MNWENLSKKQPKVATILQNSISNKRLSHAYIFEGKRGVSKFETAILFAQTLYCENLVDKPCGECNSCKRILHLSHPNIYFIEPDQNTVKKEQIQELIHEFTRSALENGPKIYIIDGIDKMTISAANSLLKFLEEPLTESYAILLTEDINRVLPTIISRSQVISFVNLGRQEIYNDLIVNGNDTLISSIVSYLTNNLSSAEKMVKDEDIKKVSSFAEGLLNCYATKDENFITYFQEYGLFITQDKSKLNSRYLLGILLDVITENIKRKAGQTIEYYESLNNINTFLCNKTYEQLFHAVEIIQNLEKELFYNVNISLLFDKLLILLDRSFIYE